MAHKLTPVEVIWEDDVCAGLWCEEKLVREATHTLMRDHIAQVEAHLKTADVDYSVFDLPADIVIRPILHGESMHRLESGELAILDEGKQEFTTCLSWEACERDVDIHINVTDRCSTNVCGLHHLMELQILMLTFFGWFHGQWNGLKRAARRCLNGKVWKAISQLTVFFNLPFGPFKKKVWFHTMREALQQLMATNTHLHARFQELLELIGRGYGYLDTSAVEVQKAIWARVGCMRSNLNKGPILKLARWGSIRQVRDFKRQDVWGNKVLLEEIAAIATDADVRDLAAVAHGTASSMAAGVESNARQPSALMRAHRYITEENIDALDVFCLVTTHENAQYVERAKLLKTPDAAFEHNMEQVRWAWRPRLLGTVSACFDMDEMMLMRMDEGDARASCLCNDVLQLVLHVLEERAEVVIPEALAHPWSSIACLHADAEVASDSRVRLQFDFNALLWGESVMGTNRVMKRLMGEIPWRRFSAIRLYMFTNDLVMQDGNDEPDRLNSILWPIHKRILDEKGAEDLHQFCRDEGRRKRFDEVTPDRVFRACRDANVARKGL